MHNLGIVLNFEFVRALKKKSFWISVLAFPVMMGVVSGLIYVSNHAASSAEQETNTEKFSLEVLDESGLILPSLLVPLEATAPATKEAGIRDVQNGTVDAFFYYPQHPAAAPVEVFAKDEGFIKNGKYTAAADELLKNSVLSALESEEKITIARTGADTTLVAYKGGSIAAGIEQVIAPGLFLILFYILIILLGNQMLASTTEEKENRVIEMILTTVQSRTLIVGKMLAMILLGALQIVIILLPILLLAVFFGDKLNLPQVDFSQLTINPLQLAAGAFIFIFSFLFFTGVLVTIGAIMPTAKEASSFFGLVMFSMFIPLYAFMAIVSDPTQLIVKIFSFFPLTAPVTLLLRNAVGNLSAMEASIGVVVLAASAALALMTATRAFRYGTLEYSRRLSLKELLRRS